MQFVATLRSGPGFRACERRTEVRTNVACVGGVTINNPNDPTGRQSDATWKNCMRGCRNSTPVGSRRTSLNSRAPIRRGSAWSSRRSMVTFTKLRHAAAVHHPVDFEAADVRRGARGSRRRTGRQAIGVEPSGDAFNSISLEPGTGRPLNPMISLAPLRLRRSWRAPRPKRASRARGRCDFRLCRSRARHR